MLSRSKCSLLSVPLCAAVSTPTPVSQQQLLLSPSCPKPAQPRVLSNAQASAGSWGTSLPTTLAPNQGAGQCWAQNYTGPSQLFPDSLVLRSSCRTLACLPPSSGPCLREPHFCIGRWHMLETSPPPTHTHCKESRATAVLVQAGPGVWLTLQLENRRGIGRVPQTLTMSLAYRSTRT